MNTSIKQENKNEKGQGLVEYALILVLVSIVVIGALLILGPAIGNIFSTINSTLQNPSGSASIIGGGEAAAAPTETPTSYAQLCAHWGRPSGATVGPYPDALVLMTTSGGYTATLWANDPAMSDPSSQYYNPTIHETLPANTTGTCP